MILLIINTIAPGGLLGGAPGGTWRRVEVIKNICENVIIIKNKIISNLPRLDFNLKKRFLRKIENKKNK